MKSIPIKFLKQLSASSELYQICPIEVKRQIWEVNEDLYKDEIYSILHTMLTNINNNNNNQLHYLPYEMTVETTTNNVQPVKRRSDDKQLQEITTIIGNSLKLYNLTLHYLRELYVNIKHPLFCIVRTDLVMSFHDNGISQIYEFDGCHNLAWCLDACVRDNSIGIKRIQELQSYFDTVPDNDLLIGDISMILANPYTINMLLRNLLSSLRDVSVKKMKPKNSVDIMYITQLLSFGYSSDSILRNQSFQFPSLEQEIINKFYVSFITLFSEEEIPTSSNTSNINTTVTDIPNTTNVTTTATSTSATTTTNNTVNNTTTTPLPTATIAHIVQLPKELDKYITRSVIAKQLTLCYIVHRTQKKDDKMITALLNLFEKLQISIEQEQSFIQSLISELIPLAKVYFYIYFNIYLFLVQ